MRQAELRGLEVTLARIDQEESWDYQSNDQDFPIGNQSYKHDMNEKRKEVMKKVSEALKLYGES